MEVSSLSLQMVVGHSSASAFWIFQPSLHKYLVIYFLIFIFFSWVQSLFSMGFKSKFSNSQMAFWNFSFAFFNLLPIYPLDGYRIYYALLSKYFDELYSFDLLFYLSLLIGIILIIFLYIFNQYYYIILIMYLLINNLILRKRTRQKININTIVKLLK